MALYWKVSEFIRLGKASSRGASMSDWECLMCRGGGVGGGGKGPRHVSGAFVSVCPCNHIFHASCIVNIVKTGCGDCPQCGTSIDDVLEITLPKVVASTAGRTKRKGKKLQLFQRSQPYDIMKRKVELMGQNRKKRIAGDIRPFDDTGELADAFESVELQPAAPSLKNMVFYPPAPPSSPVATLGNEGGSKHCDAEVVPAFPTKASGNTDYANPQSNCLFRHK